VASFVGTDWALKRLGLTTLAEVQLLPADDIAAGTRSVPVSATVRRALSEILSGRGAPIAVVDADGTVVGAISLELIAELTG
jgi:hypothetical protein